jgi:hypothetical protein
MRRSGSETRGARAVTNTLLLIIVLGAVLIALVIDIAALLSWLRRRRS